MHLANLPYALSKPPICTWQTAMSVRESSRPLGDLRMQRRYWSYWAAPESLGMDLPDRVFPANRVANIAAVDAVDIRLRRLPTSASAEAPVSSSSGAGSGRQTGARYRPVCNHSSRCGAPVPPGDQVSLRCTTLPSGACHPQPRPSGEGFRAVRPRGEPDRLTCTNGGAQRTVP